ncbi:hypothetical protein JCM7686_0286 [Paracoccus aminophilus JCM 7686]|uniref:Uncharacterized protein n=1 Tax=Paracoccus aminophilus JCM 7686 TaxID=1367847 RepID=S5XQQ3_PARAH|nr:hypothetical protein JCM7686_0286 [Paracoccus aminophilus JCM 7686]
MPHGKLFRGTDCTPGVLRSRVGSASVPAKMFTRSSFIYLDFYSLTTAWRERYVAGCLLDWPTVAGLDSRFACEEELLPHCGRTSLMVSEQHAAAQ